MCLSGREDAHSADEVDKDGGDASADDFMDAFGF